MEGVWGEGEKGVLDGMEELDGMGVKPVALGKQ